MIKRSISLDIITAEASEWFLLMRVGDISATQKREFMEWLRQSPIHVQEYLGVAETWTLVAGSKAWPEAAEAAAAASALSNVVPLSARASSADGRGRLSRLLRNKTSYLGLAAALVGMFFVLELVVRIASVGDVYKTERGEQRSIILEDGSVMQLNTLSTVRVAFDEGHRKVELVDGEAYFRVAHNPTRPFDVTTRKAVVRAVGTAFNVYSRGDRLDVAVAEGRVRVSATSAQRSGSPTLPKPVFLDAHERLEVKVGSPPLRTAMAAEAARVAWMDRRLVFHGERLDAVIAAFNLYSEKQLKLDSAELAELRISGTFNADDPETLVAYLKQVQGVKVGRLDGVTHLRTGATVKQ